MTSKRDLKKYINRMASEVAEVVLPAAVYTGAIDNEKAIDVLNEISILQTKALAKLNIAYDKTPEAFDSSRAYTAAKRAYFNKAYAQALSDYEGGIQKLIAPLNKVKK